MVFHRAPVRSTINDARDTGRAFHDSQVGAAERVQSSGDPPRSTGHWETGPDHHKSSSAVRVRGTPIADGAAEARRKRSRKLRGWRWCGLKSENLNL